MQLFDACVTQRALIVDNLCPSASRPTCVWSP